MQQYRKNLGKVSLTAEGVWDIKSKYDVLSIVYDEHTQHGFISKKEVPEGVDITNKEYWMPLNVSGYADNNMIILSKKTSESTIESYTLEEAVKSIASVGRRPGTILGFYNENSDRMDIGGCWELWQYNGVDVADWENLNSWNSIYYNYNKFVGWYRNEDILKKYVPFPEIGCYAYVGSDLNDAVIYRCDRKYTWTNTIEHVWNYFKVIVGGNVTVGENGNWFNNGVDTNIPASVKGENGKTPIIRNNDNVLEVSYDNVNWEPISDEVAVWARVNNNKLEITKYKVGGWEVVSDYIAAWFRWQSQGGQQAFSTGKIQITRDGVTWTDLSGEFVNNLRISKYIGADESLPTSGIAEGTIYAKGPYYAENDTLNDNPIYRLWVYAWKDNTLAWQDNGEFTSIAAGVVQDTGDSETEVMSQKAVTKELSKLGSDLKGADIYSRYSIKAGESFIVRVTADYVIKKGQIVKFKLLNEDAEITKYGIGTSNGYYFEGLGAIPNSPNTQYSYIITDEMYQYMVDADNYSLYLYIPGENIVTSGNVTLEINYNYSESVKGLLESNIKKVNENSETLSKVVLQSNSINLELRGTTIEVPKNKKTYYYININKGDVIILKNNYTYSLSHQILCYFINEDDTEQSFTTLNGGKKIQIISDKKYKGLRFGANEDNTITIGYNNVSLPADKTIISDIRELKGSIENLTIPENNLSFEYDGVTLTPQPYAIIAGVTYECYFAANNQWAVGTYDESGKIVESGVVTLSSHEYGYFTATKNACFVGGYTSANKAGTFLIKVSDVQNGIKTKYQAEYNTYISEKKQVPNITKFENLHIVNIANQSDFDNIHTIINNSVVKGYKNIAVCFSSDTFFYSEKHFNLISSVYSSCEDVNLHLFGLNTKIVPKGTVYNYKNAEGIFDGYYKYPCADKYNYKDLFVDKDGNEISTYGEVKYAESAVETVDEESSYYRFKLAYEDKDKYASYIKLSTWFTSDYEEIDKIEDGYLYFYQKQINTNINGDNHFPKVNYGTSRNIYPRYKLLNSVDSNIYLKDGYLYVKCSIEEVVYCKSKQFLELQDTFNSLTISGFIFKGSVGNSDFYYHAEKQPVGFININAFEGEFVNISNNEFNCLKDFAVRVSNNNTSNIIVNNNKCFNSYRGLVIGTSTSRNIFAINNECINNGIYAYYEGVFTMSGKNFLISNNKIVDFPYAAIRSGAEYPGEGNETEGIIENNYIKLSDKYVAESYKHCLMDQGSIYVYCEVEKLIIRYNIIINSTGQYQNNGIMIDGYASNCKILGNLVIGTSSRGICRSILSYKSNNNETKAVNNFIMNNIIDTKYRFTGWEGCIKGANILLKTDKTVVMQNNISIPNTEDDYQVYNVIRQGDVYLIPARYEFALYKFLTINPVIASYIRFSNFN